MSETSWSYAIICGIISLHTAKERVLHVTSLRILFFSTVVLLSACKTDPATPGHWEKRLSSAKNSKDRTRVIEELRESKFMGQAMVPMLEAQLASEKSAEVKASIARLLGIAKSPSSVAPLNDAYVADAQEPNVATLNREIAMALGNIGGGPAASALIPMLKSRNSYTVVAAIESLGGLKSPEAYAELDRLANDDKVHPFITKKALEALGNIGDPRAIPTLIRGMYREREGASYYREASFALYQIGSAAADPLLAVVEGRDSALKRWASDNKVVPFVLPLKALQVLSDLNDSRAESRILSSLDFKDPSLAMTLIVRMRAADAAARLRSQNAAAKLAKMVTEDEPNARHEYAWALTRIGAHSAANALIDSAKNGPWEARRESAIAYAMLSDDPNPLDKLAEQEPQRFAAECRQDPDAPSCADVAGNAVKHGQELQNLKKRATAGQVCRGDLACWVKFLDDADEGVRERAAYEVGRSRDGAHLGKMLAHVKEQNLSTRIAFIQGALWLVYDVPTAKASVADALPKLKDQLADERGKTDFEVVNEDLRRLVVALERK